MKSFKIIRIFYIIVVVKLILGFEQISGKINNFPISFRLHIIITLSLFCGILKCKTFNTNGSSYV